MGVAAEFDPKLFQAKEFAEPLGPEKVGAAFVERDDVVVVNVRQDPFPFAPNTRGVRPLVAFVAPFEKKLPASGGPAFQSFEVVLHLQQGVAPLAMINDGVER